MRIPILLAFVFLPLLVLAQGAAVPSPEQLEPFLRALVAAVQGGKWQVVAILVGIGLVAAIRRWGVKVWPALGSKRAGAITGAPRRRPADPRGSPDLRLADLGERRRQRDHHRARHDWRLGGGPPDPLR